MTGRRQPSFFKDSTDKCLSQLKGLKQTAQDGFTSSPNFSRAKRELLASVLQDVNDSLRTLEAWIKEFAKADQTKTPELLEQATSLFVILSDSIEKAANALTSRLQHRKLSFRGLFFKKRHTLEKQLIESLKVITNTISKLNNVSKVVRGPSAKQEDRDKRKTLVLESASKPFDAFTKGFTAIDPSRTQDVLPIALEMLWKHFPGRPGLENKVGNAENPGDGLLYDGEYVAQATMVLQDLVKAWQKTKILEQNPPPPQLQEMSKICLILTGMQKQDLLVDFLGSSLTDSDLCLDEQKLNDILKEEHRLYATLFFTEQFRAKPREWAEGSHEKFRDEEPMPLVFKVDEPLWGSFGSVMKVEDPVTGDVYVRKQQIITADKKLMQAARNHIEQETQRLKGLRHRHVVELVKSYERGEVYGLVLKPAANSDLGRLLERYKKDKFYHRKGCTDSVWLRPVFYTAFGCLAKGLEYIHGCKLRHKDIKPDNILYEQPSASKNNHDRFLWADFGLAYDFSDKEDSKTRSTKLYSPRYAPPEVVESNAREKSKRVAKLDEIKENGEILIRAEMNPKASDEEVDAHGRAADRFGLGCVYFELLSRLVGHDLPLRPNHENRILFSNNIECLCDWAKGQKNLDDSVELGPVFDIAIAMIHRNPEKRPEIKDIVQRIMEAGKEFSCQLCHNEYQIPQANKNLALLPTAVTTPSPPPQQKQKLPLRRLSRINSSLSFSKSSLA